MRAYTKSCKMHKLYRTNYQLETSSHTVLTPIAGFHSAKPAELSPYAHQIFRLRYLVDDNPHCIPFRCPQFSVLPATASYRLGAMGALRADACGSTQYTPNGHSANRKSIVP